MNMDNDEQPPSTLIGRCTAKLNNLFSSLITKTPQSRDELIEVLNQSKIDGILDQEALDTIQRILGVADLSVRDIMIPRSQAIMLDKDYALDECLAVLIKSAHSRFPVLDPDDDEITGILLAKDILQFFDMQERNQFNLHDLLRPAIFVPESKHLNVLLAQFRSTRNHMAIVVDEYGGVSGLVTIEDVLEQIVGEIDDEHDVDNDLKLIRKLESGDHIVKAILPLEEFNAYFGTRLTDKRYDTFGGLILKHTGHVAQRGEKFEMAGLTMEIVHADRRRIHLVRIFAHPPKTKQPSDKPKS